MSYVVTAELTRVFDKIPPKVPPLTDRVGRIGDTVPRVVIYGSVFTGRPAAGNAAWVEIAESAGGFVPARDVRREPSFDATEAQGMVVAASASVFLTPSPGARPVLLLVQGEVFPVTGTLRQNGQVWYRGMFTSHTNWSTVDSSENRYGWIAAGQAKTLKQGLNEGELAVAEVPVQTRGIGESLSDPDRIRLARQGLLVRAMSPDHHLATDDFADAYQAVGGPVFITSDLFLHGFHLVFDRMLQAMETEKMLPALKALMSDMLKESLAMAATSRNGEVRRAMERNVWYCGVAVAMLGGPFPVPPAMEQEVKKELALIHEAKQQGVPCAFLPGFKEDYTQYRPRGHYTLSPELGSYFKVMMHLGRKSFMLKDDSATLSAMLMSRMFFEPGRMARWKGLVDPISFLVGDSDDWGPPEYLKVLARLGADTPEELAKPARITGFRRLAVEMLSPQRIVSQRTRKDMAESMPTQSDRLELTQGFKLIGQRYTPDAEYFQRLTTPPINTDAHSKNLPSGLEIMSILGSGVATRHLPEAWSAAIPEYRPALEELRAGVEHRSDAEWSRTAYVSWLQALRALFAPTKSHQFFAKTEAWEHKSLNSGLGSWTELKHDTILYSEQSYAESGDGGEDDLFAPSYEPPLNKGYIEPNPEFFASLRRIIGLTKAVVDRSGTATGEYSDKLLQLDELTERAGAIALQEVEGRGTSVEDYMWIAALPSRFGQRLLLPQDALSRIDQKYLRMALIADVATDAMTGSILSEAIGVPQEARVVVKDYSGGTRVTTGYVYSWAEFVGTKRWTDEEWKSRIYETSPDDTSWMPDWYKFFR